MKFVYSWLKDLSNYKGTPDELAEILSSHSFETEIVSNQEFKGIIVAKVLKIEKHPNADRLRVVELTDGVNIYAPVVCGAWNFEAGAIVALALPGALIPHNQHDPSGAPFTLGKATIRGVESQGMICSAKELGLSEDGKGILLLDETYKLGNEFSSKSSEIFFDISAPANRPDLLGYLGIAREIAALTGSGLNFKPPKIKLDKLRSKILKVNIANEKLCPRYIGVRLANIQIGPSPEFIQKRIKLAGHKPINNVVDITNYVMLLCGQPLHAFDAAKLQTPIHVRNAYLNEKIKTLDGVDRQLNPQNLVIADGRNAVAVAGVIGGANSMVDEFTSEVILEAANFDSVSVRRTARELGLRTDASSRFEKSLPIGLTDFAAAYATELLVAYANAKPIEAVRAGTRIPVAKKISLNPDQVNSLLGTSISAQTQKEILNKFGFKLTGSKTLSVSVPYDRPDVSIWQDLAEEIARYEGLDKVDPVPAGVIPSFEMNNPVVDLRSQAALVLTGLGYSEVYTYSFVSEKDLSIWDIEKKIAVKVANPLSSDQEYMRPNLLMNVMKAADHNSRYSAAGNYFEISNIYWKEDGELIEKTYLAMMSFDRDYPTLKLTSSFVELATRFNVAGMEIVQESEQLAAVKFGKETIGHIGRVSVGELKWVGVHLDFEAFIKHIQPKTFTPIIKYPKKEIDIAVWARRDLEFAKIVQIIKSLKSEIIQNIELLEIYTGKNVPMHKKSITFRIVYQSPVKTLKDTEVDAVQSAILKELKARLNLEVR